MFVDLHVFTAAVYNYNNMNSAFQLFPMSIFHLRKLEGLLATRCVLYSTAAVAVDFFQQFVAQQWPIVS